MIDIGQLLVDEQSVITNTHVVFTSGKHGDTYIDARVYAHKSNVLNKISEALAWAIMTDYIENTFAPNHLSEDFLFVGPETLGREYARLTSIYYNEHSNAKSDAIFCSIDEAGAHFSDKLNFGRLIPGRKIIYVDDLMNESSTFFKVKKLIEELGGEIVLAMTVVNRQPEKNTAEALGIPQLIALKEIHGMNVYDPDNCPLCAAKVPMRPRPGHGKEWLAKNPDYPVLE